MTVTRTHGKDAARGTGSEPQGPLQERVDVFRRAEIQASVERHAGNWAAAARELGMHRSNLHHLARRLGLKPA